jgi:hypothetical protein
MRRPTLILAALLTGCAAQVPGDVSRMSPEQIQARPNKNAAIGCIWVRTLMADTVSVFADVDLLPKGRAVAIGADCSVTIGGEVAE